MNLQDIAEFIDLVNNPAKYERVLNNIKEEQERLNAVIETVGKASELDKLRKQVEKEREDNSKELQRKVQDAESRLEQQFKVAAETQKTADVTKEQADKALVAAQLQEDAAQKLAKSFEGRDKELRTKEEFVKQLQVKYENLVAEYGNHSTSTLNIDKNIIM